MPKEVPSRPVYSTDGGRLCPQCHRSIANCVCGNSKPQTNGDGIVRIRRETKGRAGKAVTVVDGLNCSPTELKALCKNLKQRCGVGGAVKDDRLEIQGDQRSLCQQQLESLGFQVKQSGG
ncbi:MAG: translation initiation factor [Luminiphilus sp.]|nr:translation initiation factor [Luminiphilus sp.]